MRMGLGEDRHILHLFCMSSFGTYCSYHVYVCIHMGMGVSVCIYVYNIVRMTAVIAMPCSSRRNEKVEEL